jgi:hypothetical protein
VAQLVGIADVSRRVVAGRGIARVGVAILPLDVVGPGRGMDEGEALAVGVRGRTDYLWYAEARSKKARGVYLPDLSIISRRPRRQEW